MRSMAMNNIKHQRGVATIVLVVLMGITIMLVTASIAKSISSKKEATVAAHAQTNSQMMAWAGLNAFQQYLQSGITIESLKTSINLPVSLKVATSDSPNSVVATIRSITPIAPSPTCALDGHKCQISVDIEATNTTGKASSIINAIFEVEIVNGVVQIIQNTTLSFGGDTTFSGTTTIGSEIPNATVNLNVNNGTLTLNSGLRLQNISVLNVKAKGDVVIECGVASNCGNTIINVTTDGKVNLRGGTNNFGDIKATGTVELYAGAEARNITALGTVTLSASSAKNVISNGDVTLNTDGQADNVYANGNVKLWASTVVNNNIESKGTILVSGGKVGGNINSSGDITVNSFALIQGDLTTEGDVDLSASTIKGNIGSRKNVVVSASVIGQGAQQVKAYGYVRLRDVSTINGTVYAKGNNEYLSNAVYNELWSKITGDVYVTRKSLTGGTGEYNGSTIPNTSTTTNTNFTVTPSFTSLSTFNATTFRSQLTTDTTLTNRVSVTAYKNEANYIFTLNNQVTRVYLNKLKNKATGITYSYMNGLQSATDANNLAVSLLTDTVSKGFALGKYTLNGNIYYGAVCEKVDANNMCASSIIGYLPRISIERNSAILLAETANSTEDYSYYYLNSGSQYWRIRSLAHQASLNNALLAPGIMYFEGGVELAGGSLAPKSVVLNSILATGDITAIAFSPVVYSPYNAIRDGGTVELVCNRTLKNFNGAVLNIGSTTPLTQSDKYLVPTNLCRSDTVFAKTMDKKSDGTADTVVIDGVNVPKLDLGNVALMSDASIQLGSCANVFGDVLARGYVDISTTGSCNVTADIYDTRPNVVSGNITSQAAIRSGNNVNDITGGTRFIAPASNSGSTGTGNMPIVGASSVKLSWSKFP